MAEPDDNVQRDLAFDAEQEAADCHAWFRQWSRNVDDLTGLTAQARCAITAIADVADGLRDLIVDVASSGVERDEPHAGYVVVQIDRVTWQNVRKLATQPNTTKPQDCGPSPAGERHG